VSRPLPTDASATADVNTGAAAPKENEGTMSVHLATPTVGSRRSRRSDRPRRRSLRLWLVLVVTIAAVSFTGATVSSSSHAATAGAASTCSADGNGGCLVTLPCPAGQTTNCPTVDVAPNTNLNNNQYVYVTTTNFDPTGSVRVALCSASTSSTDPSCLNGPWSEQALTPTKVPVVNDPSTANLTSLSYPVFLDPAGQGNNPIPAVDLVNTTGPAPGFFCDTSTSPCELVVTDEPGQGNIAGNGPTITDANSAVVPLSFATPPSGCPASDPQFNVDTSYSMEHLLPAAVSASCNSPTGVVGLTIAADDKNIATDFASGSTPVAFVDNAGDPSQVAQLLGKAYAYIPVALSGTTESFLAGESAGVSSYPINSYKLTPNMVAGLITSLYQSPVGTTTFPPKPHFALSDNLTSALEASTANLTCAQLRGCPSTKGKLKQVQYEVKYNAFDLLNRAPAGVQAPTQFGSWNSNVPSGSSYQATSWLCSAPNTPFPVTVDTGTDANPTTATATVTDPNTAPTTFTSAPLGSTIWPPYPGANWIFPTCQGYTTFPALSATSSNFGSLSTPELQAKSMRGWNVCYNGQVTPVSSCAAFGLMDTSQAQFYGLSEASLQNASGAFVAPTTASLEAAASDFTPCPQSDLSCPSGTYKINYSDPNPAAYPMANLTYAIVPTGQLSNDQGTAIKNLLTNVLSYSHSSAVPAGYAPLPDSIYAAAMTDLNNDLTIAAAPPTTTTTTTTTSTTTTPTTTTSTPSTPTSAPPPSSGNGGSGQTSTSGTSGSGTGAQISALPLTAAASSATGNSGSGTNSTPVAPPPATVPTGFLLVGLSATTRFLLPAIVVLALGSLIGGLLLLFGPGAAARRRRDTGVAP